MNTALLCLALAIYAEARGEPEPGMWMVAAVVMNRVESSRYPDDVCAVVAQRKQFSFTAQPVPLPANPKDAAAMQKAVEIARLTMAGWGKGLHKWGGITNYANLRTATHGWVRDAQRVADVGRHTLLADYQ